MKIDKSIRDAFEEHHRLNRLVEEQVRALSSSLSSDWHFISRLKSLESFAQKIEAGRGKPNMLIDDFFACTIVVRNSKEIAHATALIEEQFNVVNRRPANSATTMSKPTEFQFDDLRLYANLRESFRGREPINDVLFEIQIKTFLQHAWGIATHDLTYKTDQVSWAKLRVASQIRAMLEHAELSIDQFDRLVSSEILAKEHKEYSEIAEIIRLLREHWEPAALPQDLQRLAQTIRSASRTFDISISTMFECLEKERDLSGTTSLDLSPFGSIIQSIFRHYAFDAPSLLRKAGKRGFEKISISASVEIPLLLEVLKGKVISVY